MAGVLIKCIRMLKSFGKYSDANNLLKAEFPALESALGKDDLQVGYILFEHGQVYRKLGMGDDVPTLETAILIFEKELGKDHFDTASARMHLGIGHLACHQIQKALDLMKPAVDRIEEIVGPEDKAVVKALFELAEAHRIAGNQEEQTRLLLRSIEVSKAAYGPNHPETANQYMSYGEMLRVSNRDDEAAKYLELARDIFVASLGSGHLMAGHVENRLSSLHINTQLWSKVESHGLTCLEIYKAWYPPEHQFLGHIRAKLARGYVGAGKWKEAKAYAEESLVTLRRYSQDPFLPFCEWSLNQADTHLA
uniref:Kinesin light chain n=1 Tax=Chlamydomonas chlamydogama TaxID=225041 RepID=A0A7S2VVR9_9CHLO